MTPYDSEFQHITVPSTGQLLSRIGPSVWQGNADIYPVDPRITSAGDPRRVGHYWSQFLMAGTDPATNNYFLTDQVESEGETLQNFNVIQSSGKVIEYEGTWNFRNLFTTTAHHWVWVDGTNEYHRVQVSLDVLNPINDVKAVWTELFNAADAFQTVTVKTRDNGLQTANITGTTNDHYFGQYSLGRDDWIAFTNPLDGQAGSVARVLLSSQSDIRSSDEVTPIWADYSQFDNIELHIQRNDAGTNLAAGTSFFMDNLLITDPTLNSTSWIDSKVDRAKQWIGLIGPPIAASVTPDPGSPVNRSFVPSGGTGDWSVAANWSPTAPPDSNDTAIINSGRVANVSSNLGAISVLRLGDQGVGTLNFGPGSNLQINSQALVGAGSGANRGVVNQTGGTISITGSDPVIFLAFDADDTASYNMSGGELDTGNLWFRFGRGTMTQSGGLVNAAQLVLGEGGISTSQATYDLQGGTLKISGAANIGKAPGVGDTSANSHGTMHITGGSATFGDLLFGTDATDFVQLSGTGVLEIQQTNYSISDAQTDIHAGKITGAHLWVSTINISGLSYTEIISGIGGDYNHDGIVDAADYSIWRATVGSTTDLRADGDGNLIVDQNDYDVWKANFGSSGGAVAGASGAVPEPASWILSITALLFTGGLRTRRPRFV